MPVEQKLLYPTETARPALAPSPLRILEYITANSISGAENAALAVVAELKQRGHHLLFASPEGRRLTGVLRERGYAVWAPRAYGKVDPITLTRLVRLIRTRQVQLIHTHLSTAALLGSVAARMCGIPALAMVQGRNTATCYRFATLVVAVSEAVREHLEAQGVPGERIRVIHNGINLEHYENLPDRGQVRDSLGIPPAASVMLFGGHLTELKGAALLPEIISRVRLALPDAQLLILGAGPLRESLEREAVENGLADCVHVLGHRPDIRPYLSASDLAILPSYTEGLPMILLEAMAAGLPTVGTDAGGIPEAIAAGETGQVAPAGDAAALAEACVSILADPNVRVRMAAAGRARVHTRFSIQRNVSLLEGVFAEAMDLVSQGWR